MAHVISQERRFGSNDGQRLEENSLALELLTLMKLWLPRSFQTLGQSRSEAERLRPIVGNSIDSNRRVYPSL